jgi:copper(I)-binding protein
VRLQNRRVFGAGVSALGAALVLAGCGAGQITQTDTQQPAVNGTYAQVKTLVLRDAAVQYPVQGAAYSAGQSAPLTLTLVNQGAQDDKLVSVTSDATDGPATISGSTAIVAGHSLVIGPADPVEATNQQDAPSSSSASSSSSSSSSETAPPSDTAPPSSGSDVSTAPGAPTQLGVGTVVLQNLKQPLWPGQTIKVTFTFQNAGPVVVALPVAAPAHDQAQGNAAAGH